MSLPVAEAVLPAFVDTPMAETSGTEVVPMGITSFTLSPSINLFSSYLNLSGMDWVEKLRNMTITT